nr:fibrillin-1-like [Danaus plexippus plexippus]
MCEAGVTISMDKQTILLFALLLNASLVCSQWVCRQDSDCSSLSGSSCISGQCSCEPGQQAVLGGSMCIDVAPYFTSTCIEDFQCGGLFTGFECRKNGNSTVGQCMCQPGFHYLNGRCWRSKEHGQACSTSDECMNPARDPFSLQCNVTCQCAEGYSERQRGICRKTASAVGEACVLNSDCNYPGGVCNPRTFVCSQENDTSTDSPFRNVEIQTHQKISRVRCGGGQPCASPYVCSGLGICVCPAGYYESSRGGCLAELGSPSTPEQCVGFLAEVVGGVCTCRDNFFFDENMRDCVKGIFPSDIVILGKCVSLMSFKIPPPSLLGAARAWIRGVTRVPAIGGGCEGDEDCVIENTSCDGTRTCQCRDGFTAFEDICWETSAGFNSSCSVTAECALQSAVCTNGRCACLPNHHYKDGDCYPMIALFSLCTRSSECFLGDDISDRVVCRNGVCQCDFDYPYSEELRICTSSSTTLMATSFVIVAAILSILVQ